ncbi:MULTISPECIES: hypothetical protein [Pseudoalteromonas]|uniref:hypothetical protein n=1 Tax=Pseudoalteromonas TaxID=53246 RepID=UPI000307FC48|nr:MULTISPECIES: hypothetical protein [Pseudoalteromonas]MCF6144304.1 hypothetical protein [Pseudoalteromonas mariniglutinosa NCIMB 1770]
MFKFIIGAILGCFISFIFLTLILVSTINFDMALVTNIVIALATVVATAIHFDSVRKQRKDRVWEINKDILLDLAHSLSLVIEASEYYLELECNEFNELPRSRKPKEDVYENFKDNQEYAINVYRTLMSKELIDSIELAKKRNDQITDAVNYDAIGHTQAYLESLNSYKRLQDNLNTFIASISGVKYI